MCVCVCQRGRERERDPLIEFILTDYTINVSMNLAIVETYIDFFSLPGAVV